MPLTYVSILTTYGQIGYKLYDPNIYGDVMTNNSEERLESIKAAHKSSHGASSVRMEDYLEVIAELVDLKGYATTLDISRYMDVSAPSVTKMLHRLDDEKYLKYERYHGNKPDKKRSKSSAQAQTETHAKSWNFIMILGYLNRHGVTCAIGAPMILAGRYLDKRSGTQIPCLADDD